MKEITMKDLKAYVAQLDPGDAVGQCGSFTECLIANTAKWKYSNTVAKARFDNTTVTIVELPGYGIHEVINLSDDVTRAANRFDEWQNHQHHRDTPTKAELAMYMPELFDKENQS